MATTSVIAAHSDLTLVVNDTLLPREHVDAFEEVVHNIECATAPALEECCFCDQCDVTVIDMFAVGLRILQTNAGQIFAGVFLDCFKAGGKVEGGCRVKHQG
jgi:hypothetical protein